MEPDADTDAIVRAIREWLRVGQRITRQREKMPTPWWPAQKAMILIDPAEDRGLNVWPDRPGAG